MFTWTEIKKLLSLTYQLSLLRREEHFAVSFKRLILV
jgi:hypothetical protein